MTKKLDLPVRTQIRIDPETYQWLKAQAKGFETPNDVIRRMIGMAPRKGKRS